MKNNILYPLLLLTGVLCWTGCSEEDFSKDYDIDFPVARIIEASDVVPFVEDEITLTGENLQTASSVGIDSYKFTVVSVAADGKTMVVKVPRAVESGALTVTNKYKRTFESDVKITPQFFEARVTKWPSEIQMGKIFTLEGENMDLLKEVKLNGSIVALAGAATPEMASFSSKEADIAMGDEVVIEVTPKSGERQVSELIPVVKPKSTYLPKQTLMVLDINSAYTVENGDDAGSATMTEVTGKFGKAFRVSAPLGNGWNGTYCKIYSDNDGKGFDLSAYNNPHITMLINTFGKQGYMQPLTYDASNGEQDRHLDGKFGYGDDYKSTTNGWEWRSYSIEELGFPVAKGMIEKIGVQFRGGNVGNGNDEAFDIAVNRVMITDGPLNPTVAWDCESPLDAMNQFVLKNTGDGALQGVSEGSKFVSCTFPITGSWDWRTDCTIPVDAMDAQGYANGVWINFLVNTGNNYGNCQLEFGQGGAGLTWFNFLPGQGYGDDYKFTPTNNQWQWRSVQIDPESFGLDISQPFYVKIGATTGNWETGLFELNLDYIVFTTTPMDSNLNTDNL